MDDQSQIAGDAAILAAVGIQLSKIRQVVRQNAHGRVQATFPIRDEDSMAATGIRLTGCR